MQRMAVISESFKDCLHDPHSNYEKCMLSRMHYFDIRSSASDLTPNINISKVQIIYNSK